MIRRVFLAGSATAAASLTWPALSAGTGDGVAAASWTLGAVPNRYVVRLNGASLITDCAGATTEPDSNDVPEDAAMVVAGPRREPVAWRIATSHQTGPLTLRIALAAVDPSSVLPSIVAKTP